MKHNFDIVNFPSTPVLAADPPSSSISGYSSQMVRLFALQFANHFVQFHQFDDLVIRRITRFFPSSLFLSPSISSVRIIFFLSLLYNLNFTADSFFFSYVAAGTSQITIESPSSMSNQVHIWSLSYKHETHIYGYVNDNCCEIEIRRCRIFKFAAVTAERVLVMAQRASPHGRECGPMHAPWREAIRFRLRGLEMSPVAAATRAQVDACAMHAWRLQPPPEDNRWSSSRSYVCR